MAIIATYMAPTIRANALDCPALRDMNRI